jgi:hypothetical protein
VNVLPAGLAVDMQSNDLNHFAGLTVEDRIAAVERLETTVGIQLGNSNQVAGWDTV